MNRIMTALALSGMLIGAPAFAKTKTSSTKSVATAGDKGSDTKAEGSTDTAKPAKKPSKKSKKSAAPEGSSEKPAEAPAK